MWISSMTSGVKILLWPRMLVFRFGLAATSGTSAGNFFGSVAMVVCPSLAGDGLKTVPHPRGASEDELLFGRLEVVVVPQLLAGGDLLKILDAVGRLQLIEIEFSFEPRDLVGALDGRNGVHAQAGDLAAHIDRPVVHRVAEVLAGVAQHDHPAALHHEPGKRAGAAADDDRAAFLVDPRARADIAAAHQIAAAQCRTERRAGVLLDQDRAREHVLPA